MNEHYCGAPGCFARTPENDVACGAHYARLPVEVKIEIDNGIAHRRRTGNTYLQIRAMARAVEWMHRNIDPTPARENPSVASTREGKT